MTDIEDVFKLRNWLSVLTYDAYKYAAAGGQVAIEWTEAGLVLRLLDVGIDTDGVHGKFKKHLAPAAESAPPEAPARGDEENKEMLGL